MPTRKTSLYANKKKRQSGNTSWAEDEINLKLFLSTFSNVSGPKETSCTLAYLISANTKGFEKTYSSALEEINMIIRSERSSVINEGFHMEIYSTIRELKIIENMSTDAINSYIRTWHTN